MPTKVSQSSIIIHKILLEVIWWIITAIISYLIIAPIQKMTDLYPFFWMNLLFIVTFITLFRYLFFLRYSFIARRQLLKITIIFLSIPFIFHLISNLNYFITYIDEKSFDGFLGHLDSDARSKMQIYIRSEMLLFGVGSVVAAVLFPFKMIASIWRVRNRGAE